MRSELYELLRHVNLLLAGNSDHLQKSGKFTLAESAAIDLLCTQSPSGGKALVAFTDFDSFRKRAPHGNYIEMSAAAILQLVISSGYDGLIINPAGPWVGIPVADIPELLKQT